MNISIKSDTGKIFIFDSKDLIKHSDLCDYLLKRKRGFQNEIDRLITRKYSNDVLKTFKSFIDNENKLYKEKFVTNINLYRFAEELKINKLLFILNWYDYAKSKFDSLESNNNNNNYMYYNIHIPYLNTLQKYYAINMDLFEEYYKAFVYDKYYRDIDFVDTYFIDFLYKIFDENYLLLNKLIEFTQ